MTRQKSVQALEKEVVRRLRDNQYDRVIYAKRGVLDPYRASFHKTTPRIFRQNMDGYGKKLNLYLSIDASGSMAGKEFYAAWISMQSIRRAFKGLASVHVYFWSDTYHKMRDQVLDMVGDEPNDVDDFYRCWATGPNLQINYGSQAISYYSIPPKYLTDSGGFQRGLLNCTKRKICSLVGAINDPLLLAKNEESFDSARLVEGGGTEYGIGILLPLVEARSRPEETHVIFFFTDGDTSRSLHTYDYDYETRRYNLPDGPTGYYYNGRRLGYFDLFKAYEYIKQQTKGRDISFIPIGMGQPITKYFGPDAVTMSMQGGVDGIQKEFLHHVLSKTKHFTSFRR